MTEWLAFANDVKTFNVIKCFENLQECHWRKYSFSKGDIVYLYVKSVGRVLYKTIVVEDKVLSENWEDDKYWIESKENTDKNNRVVLRLLGRSDGELLSFAHLYENGLKTTRSLTIPNKNPRTLIDYICDNFYGHKDDDYYGEIEIQEDNQDDYLKKVYVNRYERDPEERRKCIERYGNKYECVVCGMNFEDVYGDIGRNFIHVHHIEFLSKHGKDISENLIPVCPNCHAMLHKKQNGITMKYEELREIIRKRK